MDLPSIGRRGLLAGTAASLLGGNALAAEPADGTPHAAARERLVAEVERSLRRIDAGIAEADVRRVLAAIAAVPRHRFVPEALAARAYEDRPLPIGAGQTISQPSVVALMSALLEPRDGDRVLEIGTGSGYQAAVLAQLVARVYTIEIVASLAERAARLFEVLGLAGIETRTGDGWRGWPEAAPFDAVIVTAAPETVPPPLLEQLAPGGRLVAPVGPQSGAQELLLLRKADDGSTVSRSVLPVRFVPFTRER